MQWDECSDYLLSTPVCSGMSVLTLSSQHSSMQWTVILPLVSPYTKYAGMMNAAVPYNYPGQSLPRGLKRLLQNTGQLYANPFEKFHPVESSLIGFPYTTFPYTTYPYTAFPYTTYPYTAFPYTTYPYTTFPYTTYPYTAFPYTTYPYTTYPYTGFPYTTRVPLSVPLTQDGAGSAAAMCAVL
ncbi:UNVERIFIED_CONTAM: hypothetical protein FKN15_012825 [Acipenser sinensis]